jgi:GT2 family glycosyltransferase
LRLATLITCHNRRETTLRCLRALFECRLPDDVQLHVLLVDDGSTDGTGEAVRGTYPQVEVLPGDGSLYWTGGMRKAFAVAMGRRFDHYLWLNDDTCLYQETLAALLGVAAEVQAAGHKAAIVVGSTHSRGGGPVNYGGIRKKWRHLNRELVEPQETAIPCETMHGNCVLVPHEIAQRVGNLDPAFIHTIGDIDYGLRASQAGFLILVMPGYAGICELNPLSETPFDPSLPLNSRYERLLGPKGLPFKPWLTFLWRHFGFVGLAHWLWTYVKVPLTWLRVRMRLR